MGCLVMPATEQVAALVHASRDEDFFSALCIGLAQDEIISHLSFVDLLHLTSVDRLCADLFNCKEKDVDERRRYLSQVWVQAAILQAAEQDLKILPEVLEFIPLVEMKSLMSKVLRCSGNCECQTNIPSIIALRNIAAIVESTRKRRSGRPREPETKKRSGSGEVRIVVGHFYFHHMDLTALLQRDETDADLASQFFFSSDVLLKWPVAGIGEQILRACLGFSNDGAASFEIVCDEKPLARSIWLDVDIYSVDLRLADPFAFEGFRVNVDFESGEIPSRGKNMMEDPNVRDVFSTQPGACCVFVVRDCCGVGYHLPRRNMNTVTMCDALCGHPQAPSTSSFGSLEDMSSAWNTVSSTQVNDSKMINALALELGCRASPSCSMEDLKSSTCTGLTCTLESIPSAASESSPSS